MKKAFLVSVIVFLGMSMLMASPGVWQSSSTDGVDPAGDSATMEVSFNLSGSGDGSDTNESVRIGFSENAVTSLDDVAEGQANAVLSNQDGAGKLSEDRFIFWQISSAKPMEISLSWPAEMSGTSDPTNNKLGWTITTSLPSNGAENGKKIGDENNSAESGASNSAVVLNRSKEGDGFKYGTVGSQQLTIVTDPLDTAEIDNYTATLTLSVKTK